MGNLGAYQEITSLAKQVGGVEKLMETIKGFSRQQGVREGIKIGSKNKNIWVAGAFGVGILITIACQKAPQFIQFCRGKNNKQNITAEEAEAAEGLLIQLIKEEESTEVEKSALDEEENKVKNNE